MTRRRTLHLPALLGTLAAAVLVACAAALLALSGEAEAAFPGQNGRIAYTSLQGPKDEELPFIYTIKPGGGGGSKVTAGIEPSYSPDGKKIAYWDPEGKNDPGAIRSDTEIYTINAGGGGKTQLTHNKKHDEHPAYSPGGKKIAYTRTTYDGRGGVLDEIYTINAGGGGRSKVLTTGSDPTYSPDGKKIAYVGYDNYDKSVNQTGDTELYTINASGGGKTRLTRNNIAESSPDYSPNGKRIAYSAANEVESVIYTINAGGGGRSKVTVGYTPAYSPDGKKIVLDALPDGGPDLDSVIYTIDASGGRKTQVTNTGNATEFVPSWGSRP